MKDIPNIHFDTSSDEEFDWRNMPDDIDPDDEELEQTPEDVVAMLGFDPKGFKKGLATWFKGGAGSGNFGHAGRPGIVGGSGPGIGGATHEEGSLENIDQEKMNSLCLATEKADKVFMDGGGVDNKINSQALLLKKLRKNKDFMEFVEQKMGSMRGPLPAGLGLDVSDLDTRAKNVIKYLIQEWAGSSGDSHENPCFMQFMAKKEFGLDDSAIQHLGIKYFSDEGRGKHEKAIRAFLRAQYDLTQKQLKEQGIKELILYRGTDQPITSSLNKEHLYPTVKIQTQPMSSFTTSLNVPENFGRKVMAVKVPAKAILSTPKSGFGCTDEHEIVILGDKHTATLATPKLDDNWEVVTNGSSILREYVEDKKAGRIKSYEINNTIIDLGNIDELLENADWPKRTNDVDLPEHYKQSKIIVIKSDEMTPDKWIEAWKNDPHFGRSKKPSPLANEFYKLLGEGKRVLEIGCGNGRDSIYLSSLGCSVSAIDLSPDAIKLARENDKDGNIQFEVGNAEKLKYENKTFDGIYSLSVLHSTDMNKSISEVSRVLKNGGVCLIYLYHTTIFPKELGGESIVIAFKKEQLEKLLKEKKLFKKDSWEFEVKDKDEEGEHIHKVIVYVLKKEE